jgi:hypothetical protein
MENLQPNNGSSNEWTLFVDRPAGSQPVVAMNADGRLEVFILGGLGEQAGKLYHRWQNKSQETPPLYGWNRKWEDLGGPWGSLPVVATNGNGALEIFIVSESRDLAHTWQTPPNDGWKEWQSLGGDWPDKVKNPMAGKEWLNLPVVARNYSVYGHFEVFMIGHDTKLYHSWRNSEPYGRWNYWESYPLNVSGPYTPYNASIPVVGNNIDDSLQVFVLEDDGSLFRTYQQPGYRWIQGGLIPVAGFFSNIPVLANSADGRLHVFVISNKNRELSHGQLVRLTDGSQAYTFESLGGDWPTIPVVARNADGRLEIFIVGQNRQLYHRWQTQPNNGWNSTWESLGGDWPTIP